jgi:hypothetical protein
MEFDPGANLIGFLGESKGLAAPSATVSSVNASGQVLAGYGAGVERFGVYSPQGNLLGHFGGPSFGPEYGVPTFSPEGKAIYAATEVQHVATSTATTYIAKLSFNGRVLERFGTLPAGNNNVRTDLYSTLAVAANGDAWAVRINSGQLFRFHT